MSDDVEAEAPRLRPLSGGIWTLFSWLRRSDRSSSNESITSVGSDRTAVSFDFLAPLHYKRETKPVVISQSPLTETYKKRLHERNLRRQYERDLTLRRKYGLYTEEGLGYDAFSLPPARKIPKDSSIQNRQRRATSESFIQPRAAYVPGKRRAPLPPTFVISASLPRNYKRKKPAPKPPVKLQENKENFKMNEHLQMKTKNSNLDKQYPDGDSINCKTDRKDEKKVKKEQSSKNVKLRTEKSFLKQIFDNKKRNSAIDTSHIKVLPSISELDKQAAEIIKTNKSLHSTSEMILEGSWVCTNCLRKYNVSIISCIYCPNSKAHTNKKVEVSVSTSDFNICTGTEQKDFKSSNNIENDEKKKLKMMLKEMKDSLPKRSKSNEENGCSYKHNMIVTEMPTLRIGSTIKENMITENIQSLTEKDNEKKIKILNAKDIFLTSEPSSFKQMPHIVTQTNANFANKELQFKNKKCTKYDIPQPSSGSISKRPSNNDKIPLGNSLVNDFSNISRELTNKETKLNTKSIPPQDVVKNNMLTFSSPLNKISLDKNVISLREERTLPNENLLGATKTINRAINLQDIKNIKSTDEKHPQSNYEIHTKLVIPNLTEVKQIITTTLPSLLSPNDAKIQNEKTNFVTTKKSHNHFNDVLPIASNEMEHKATLATTSISKNPDLYTPLKISSLLNPLYCPKNKTECSQPDDARNVSLKNKNEQPLTLETTSANLLSKNVVLNPASNIRLGSNISDYKENDDKSSKHLNMSISSRQNSKSTATCTSGNNLDPHSRRRNLINQLEMSIAKGDEKTAAEAAAKLAKLKLSCSVLSFSSQIISGHLKSQNKIGNINNITEHRTDKKILEPLEPDNNKIELKESLSTQEIAKLPNTIATNKGKYVKEITIDQPISLTTKLISDQIVPIDVWIEDKEATRGPIRILVSNKAVVGDLKQKAEKSLGVKIRLQRWIIGKALCSEDSTPLITLAGPDLAAPFYLCLVESDTNKDVLPQIQKRENKNNDNIETKTKDPSNVYTELMKLEEQALVSNSEEFECGVCIERCTVGGGVILRECIHNFCRNCLADVVRHCIEPVVSCPAIGCPGALQEREIRAILTPEDYEKWLARSLATAESGTRNTFHCRTRDCTGWAFCEPGAQRFPCPVCKHRNCIPCQAVHEGETCEKYQMKLRATVNAVEADQTDAGTQALLKSLIDRGEALECPECKAIIMKKWGCDWIKCSACKTEICWVTRGRRWGPGGKGDTTGGCRCGIDGKRCHPSCGYCH